MALSTATIIPSKTQSGFALRAFRGPRLSSAHRSVGSSAPTWLLAAGGSVACTARRAFGRRELVNSAGAPLCFALPAAGASLTAPAVVRALWGSEDWEKWAASLAEDCVYEDLYFPEAATGRGEILAILRQKALPKNSRLVLDHVSDGRNSCGFTWHIQEGNDLGQRGLCFLRLNERGEVAYVREVGEPLFKAGELTEKLLEALTKDQPPPERPVLKGPPQTPRTAGGIVRYLYGDVQQAGGDAVRFFADDVVYEDMNYETPFVGKPAVDGFLARFRAIQGVTFVLEEVSDGEKAVGFTYHIDIAGQPRGIRGITYYQVDEAGKVCYVRDVPESATKPPPVQQLARRLRPGLRRLSPSRPLPGDTGAAAL